MPPASLNAAVERLVDPPANVTEADIQSDVRLVLLSGSLGLADGDVVGLERQTEDGTQRRIDIEVGYTLIEVKKKLGRVTDAEQVQLAGYLATRTSQTGGSYAGILTDGRRWQLYRLGETVDSLVAVTEFTADRHDPDVGDRLVAWLEAVMATRQTVPPTPAEIMARLGASSAGYLLELGQITSLYARVADKPEIMLKRSLWAKSLESAFGTQFENTDALFCSHTYLVVVAELVAHSAIGFDTATLDPTDLVSGAKFAESGVRGVVESDFFDWVVQGASDGAQRAGERIVRSLARRVARFDWDAIDHDVLKSLYESVITPEVRHSLGEYYTPDWLAGQIVRKVVDDPANQRVLDPSCGSGTFLYQTIRHKLAAMSDLAPRERFDTILSTVTGMDLHPVAVTLARITYLLAIKDILGDRPPSGVTIPVFLGDSMQWGRRDDDRTLLGSAGLRISTESAELVAREMVFPAVTLADAVRFDALIDDLVAKATNRTRGAARPTVGPQFFGRHGIDDPETQASIAHAYDVLCDLHDRHLDHIWGYYIRNLARPLWLSVPDNQVDVLVGNPPWLRYNAMPASMQAVFKERGDAFEVRPKGKLATHADLSALFVVNAVDLYLKVGGAFGFVMPRGVLGGPHYAEFRRAAYPPGRGPYVDFEQPWDLGSVRPHLFPVPSCVAFGTRTTGPGRRLGDTALAWVGTIDQDATPDDAATALETSEVTIVNADAGPRSPYHDEVTQGSNYVPRSLVLVIDNDPGPLGVATGQRAIRSRRGGDKKPWSELPDLTGGIEAEFIRPCYLGSSIAPFIVLEPELAVVPWDAERQRLLTTGNPHLLEHPGLARWWQEATSRWDKHSSGSLTLDEQIDYQSKLAKQFPIPDVRVVYTTSGTYLAAAIVADADAIIDHKLYWYPAKSMDEARYLTAVLNSGALLDQVAPLQSQGQFGTRDFHRYPWYPPIPRFDASDPLHAELVDLARRAETAAAEIDRSGAFQTVRKHIRARLDETGIAAALDAEVDRLLTQPDRV